MHAWGGIRIASPEWFRAWPSPSIWPVANTGQAILREDRVRKQPKSNTSWQKAANHLTINKMWPPSIGPWSNIRDREASEVDDAERGYVRFPLLRARLV